MEQKLTENMINILEKYKKLILAHDKTEKRDRYVDLAINYIIEKSKEKGISKPLVVKVDFLFSGFKKEDNLFTIGMNVNNKDNKIQDNMTDDETIVGLVVDDAALVLTDVAASNELLKVDEFLTTKSKSFYKVYTVTGFLNSPFVCNYAILRDIDFKFVKVAGIERINELVKQFYLVEGQNSRPTEEAANIFKVMTRYMDIDSYNYIDENNFKIPEIYEYKSEKNFIDKALENIERIDTEDFKNGCKFDTKRTHVIIMSSKSYILEKYKKKFSEYAFEKNYVKTVLLKTSAGYSYLPDYEIEAINMLKDTKEEILLTTQQNMEVLYSMKSTIRSISFINARGYFADLGNFMSMYESAYDSDFYNDENKIFIYSKADKTADRTYYCEIEYLLSKDIGIDLSKIKIIYDNYLKFIKINE